MQEAGLFKQLGIDWKLFLSQAVNFFILLTVLQIFVYKPLLKIIKERTKKIQEGILRADEAEARLKEADEIAKGKIKAAELQSVDIIHDTNQRAKALEQELSAKAEARQQEVFRNIAAAAERQREEVTAEIMHEAAGLVKRFIAKTVELKPEAIDEALIKQAMAKIKET